MEKNKKKTFFLNQPEYAGGGRALSKFIYEQLKYPQAAFDQGIEGQVYIEYDIDFKGNVVDTRVLQGIGHGCDEEACRVVRLLKFEVGKNRGVRVLFHKKVTIQFKKPAVQAAPMPAPPINIQYNITPAEASVTETTPKETVYSYTIRL
jgi:TonB family protein